MGLVIAGERSGVGKTTITLALLAALQRRQLTVQSFKVGPDYIDPMFHQFVTGRPCRNLDPVLTSEAYVQACFARHSQGVEKVVVEGVMGLFDGSSQPPNPDFQVPFASTAHIAWLLNLPVLLVIDCSRLSGSVAAIALGYRSLAPQINLAGVVLNRVGSDRHLELLQAALEPLHLPILGVLRRQDQITIPDRHLGLIPTAELPELNAIIDRLATLGKTCFNWDLLLPLLASDPVSSTPEPVSFPQFPVRVAIAQDPAFNFYYADNLDLLQHLGAELIPWSPLTDSELPENTQALYFGGGFPEVFAQQLAENTLARQAVKTAALTNLPIYAECGGLMYLCDRLIDFAGQSYPMVGILPATALMSKWLTLGYREAIALQESPLLSKGERVWGHEFHRSHLNQTPTQPLFERVSPSPSQEGWQVYQTHASYLHLHWGDRWQIPARFLQHSRVSS